MARVSDAANPGQNLAPEQRQGKSGTLSVEPVTRRGPQTPNHSLGEVEEKKLSKWELGGPWYIA